MYRDEESVYACVVRIERLILHCQMAAAVAVALDRPETAEDIEAVARWYAQHGIAAAIYLMMEDPDLLSREDTALDLMPVAGHA